MTSNPEFPIAGATAWDQAVTLSGVLAEFGVASLRVETTGGRTLTISAGGTDLPRLLAGGSIGVLSCDSLGLSVRIGGRFAAECSRIDVCRRLQEPT